MKFDEKSFFCFIRVFSLYLKPTTKPMKLKNVFLLSAMLFLMSGCFVKSLHPFYRDNEVIFKKEITGNWTGADSSVWKIEQSGKFAGLFKPDKPENCYKISYTDRKGTAMFIVHLFRLGDKYFLDFYPDEVESVNDMMTSHLVPMHTVARVDMAPDRIVIRWYDEEWLIGLFRQNKIRIAHEKVPYEMSGAGSDNYQVILTASTDDLQKFMLKYSDDPNAFKNDYTFILNKDYR